eukprot:gene24006-9579_t
MTSRWGDTTSPTLTIAPNVCVVSVGKTGNKLKSGFPVGGSYSAQGAANKFTPPAKMPRAPIGFDAISKTHNEVLQVSDMRLLPNTVVTWGLEPQASYRSDAQPRLSTGGSQHSSSQLVPVTTAQTGTATSQHGSAVAQPGASTAQTGNATAQTGFKSAAPRAATPTGDEEQDDVGQVSRHSTHLPVPSSAPSNVTSNPFGADLPMTEAPDPTSPVASQLSIELPTPYRYVAPAAAPLAVQPVAAALPLAPPQPAAPTAAAPLAGQPAAPRAPAGDTCRASTAYISSAHVPLHDKRLTNQLNGLMEAMAILHELCDKVVEDSENKHKIVQAAPRRPFVRPPPLVIPSDPRKAVIEPGSVLVAKVAEVKKAVTVAARVKVAKAPKVAQASEVAKAPEGNEMDETFQEGSRADTKKPSCGCSIM